MSHSIDELNAIVVFQWESISDAFDKSNLFLGNGFSISLCNKLSYKSLFDKFKLTASSELLKVFSDFNTNNFELIIQILNNTEKVNEIINNISNKIEPLRDELRDGLIKTVQDNHPTHSEIYYPQLRSLGYELLDFSDIFTTNYDVFLYKSILQVISDFRDKKQEDPFIDYFYEAANPTELKFSNSNPYSSARSIYYLHGALFLYVYRNQRSTYKLRRLEQLRLEYIQLIRREIENNNFPIFVAEGHANDKLSTINNNSYLSFCASKLQTSFRNITFYGFSFSEPDKHIVNFANKSHAKQVAISIYKGDKTLEELEKESSFFRNTFTNKDVVVYDSETLFHSLRSF
ncbi:DUF4917 family protein [Hymenobacter sp. BT188]|uniref:DUF4917 family protein n=1 Tax=Hymenobacter sp. BT188 TaxID=2763504 RepID=UPI00165109F8|nr:DUF4917 family protein [Hymenobacter sp. BT188]MBC6605666.1 DUF4917 family protein [Hymenobacter sp. BT188]